MDRGSQGRTDPTFESVLSDPSASFALKAVLRDWARRDWLDAANDARILVQAFENEAVALIRRVTWSSG